MNIIEEKIIVDAFMDIVIKGEYPKFGSPEVHCNKCMFYGIACNPSDNIVGCFHGWKKKQ